MKAKFIYEAMSDVLKPKKGVQVIKPNEEWEKIYEKAYKEWEKYVTSFIGKTIKGNFRFKPDIDSYEEERELTLKIDNVHVHSEGFSILSKNHHFEAIDDEYYIS